MVANAAPMVANECSSFVATLNEPVMRDKALHSRPLALHWRPLAFPGFALALFVAASGFAQAQLAPSKRAPVEARTHMAAAADPRAVDAALAMLDRGGSAVDAMIA